MLCFTLSPEVTAGSQRRPRMARVSRAGAETGRWPCKFLMAGGTWGSSSIKEADQEGRARVFPDPNVGRRRDPGKRAKPAHPKVTRTCVSQVAVHLDLSLYRGNTAGRCDDTASKLQGPLWPPLRGRHIKAKEAWTAGGRRVLRFSGRRQAIYCGDGGPGPYRAESYPPTTLKNRGFSASVPPWGEAGCDLTANEVTNQQTK